MICLQAVSSPFMNGRMMKKRCGKVFSSIANVDETNKEQSTRVKCEILIISDISLTCLSKTTGMEENKRSELWNFLIFVWRKVEFLVH